MVSEINYFLCVFPLTQGEDSKRLNKGEREKSNQRETIEGYGAQKGKHVRRNKGKKIQKNVGEIRINGKDERNRKEKSRAERKQLVDRKGQKTQILKK